MGIELLTERYKDQIAGVLSCYDRIIIQGTVPGWCYASGMTSYFYEHQMRIFDYPKWAEPLRDALRKNMEQVAADNAIGIEFVRSAKKFRKEKRVKEILEQPSTVERMIRGRLDDRFGTARVLCAGALMYAALVLLAITLAVLAASPRIPGEV